MKDVVRINQTTRRTLVWLLLACVIVNPFLFIWQWGDFTDTGYHATLAQGFADDIAQNIIHSEAVLSFFLGYVWLYLFPDSGLLGLSCLAAGIVVLISLAPLVALTRATEKTITVLFGVFAAQSYYIRGWLNFGYDDVALLFLVWAATCMICFISNNKKVFIWLSGILVAAAFFARLPSITGISLIVIPWMTGLIAASANAAFRENFKNFLLVGIMQSFLFLSGVMTGLLLGIATMWATGVLDIYWKDLAVLFTGSQAVGTHNFDYLLHRYLGDLKRLIWPWFVLTLLWFLSSFAILRSEVPKLLRWSYITGLLLIIILSIGVHPVPSFIHPIKYLVLACFTIIGIFLLINYRKLNSPIYASLLAGFCIMVVGMAGSDTGLLKTQAGMFFLIPACLVGLSQFKDHKWFALNVPWFRIGCAVTTVVLVLSLITRIFCIYPASSRYSERFHFLHTIEIPKLAGLRTSTQRADFLHRCNAFLAKIPKDVPLYVFGHSPILYFASERRPFIREIWISDGNYSLEYVFGKLERKTEHSEMLPIIAVTNRNVLGDAGWLHMQKFLNVHGYILADEIKSGDRMSAEFYLPPEKAIAR